MIKMSPCFLLRAGLTWSSKFALVTQRWDQILTALNIYISDYWGFYHGSENNSDNFLLSFFFTFFFAIFSGATSFSNTGVPSFIMRDMLSIFLLSFFWSAAFLLPVFIFFWIRLNGVLLLWQLWILLLLKLGRISINLCLIFFNIPFSNSSYDILFFREVSCLK